MKFIWESLDPDEVFRLDVENSEIRLNSRFKKDIARGPARGDAPLFKLVLVFLLQQDLGKSFLTSKSTAWLRRVNHALIASLKD